VPDVASISSAAGVFLVPDVLSVCRVPCFCWSPRCSLVGFSAVAFIPAVDGVFAVASFLADPEPVFLNGINSKE